MTRVSSIVLPLLLVIAFPAAGQNDASAPKKRVSVSVSDGMRYFSELCLSHLPDFSGSGAEWREEGVVTEAEGGVWLHDTLDLSYLINLTATEEKTPFCSLYFRSDDAVAYSRAFIDNVFGGGTPDPKDGSVFNSTIIAGNPALLLTTVEPDEGGRSWIRLQAYQPPPNIVVFEKRSPEKE